MLSSRVRLEDEDEDSGRKSGVEIVDAGESARIGEDGGGDIARGIPKEGLSGTI